ncbi:MAG: hypothetical protein LUF04_09900, partial [Bacteroides sp.]|nr:hypothetical protein [Bacteroides sp.]
YIHKKSFLFNFAAIKQKSNKMILSIFSAAPIGQGIGCSGTDDIGSFLKLLQDLLHTIYKDHQLKQTI